MTGAFTRRDFACPNIARDLEMVYTYFPRLRGAAVEPGRLHLGRRAADDGESAAR